MKAKKEENGKYTTVSIPKTLMAKVEAIVTSNTSNYQNKTDFVLDAIRERLKELEEPIRFKHANTYDDHSSVKDFNLGREVNVWFQHEKLFCDFCEANNCEHIRFLLEEDNTRRKLVEKGFKLSELGKIVGR